MTVYLNRQSALKFNEMNSTDKEDGEGGKPTQSDGAVQTATVTGERRERGSPAKNVCPSLLVCCTIRQCRGGKIVHRQSTSTSGSGFFRGAAGRRGCWRPRALRLPPRLARSAPLRRGMTSCNRPRVASGGCSCRWGGGLASPESPARAATRQDCSPGQPGLRFPSQR